METIWLVWLYCIVYMFHSLFKSFWPAYAHATRHLKINF